MQDHTSTATTDPNVQYAYEDGASGADLDANYVRPTSVTYPGPSTRRVVHYNYASSGVGAPLGRLANIADDDTSPTDTYASYTYLGASTVVKVEYPAVTVSTDSLALTYGTSADSYAGFDRFGRVVDHKWQIQSGTPDVKDRYTYAYDRTSNRLYRKNELKAELSELYHANGSTGAYDGLDRLTDFRRGTLSASVQDGSLDTVATVSRIQAWTLDPVGNWSTYKQDADGTGWDLEQTREHNPANEIADTTDDDDAITEVQGNPNWIDPAYDNAGNMTAGPKPGAETATTSNYTYDAWNRLVKVADGETTTAEYRYDGQHRRIRKYTAPSGDDWTVREYYYNESWQVLEVRKATKTRTGGAEPALADTLHKQYIWGADYIDSAVVRFRDSNETPDGVLNETLYYTHDAQFNTTALVTPAGAVAERYMYDPYGQVTVLNGAAGTDPDVTGGVLEWSADTGGSDYDNEVLYCGYRHDPQTGLYHVRNRYYHPTLGRWATRDPSGYRDGMNLYEYVRSSPMDYVDWNGMAAASTTRPASTRPTTQPSVKEQADEILKELDEIQTQLDEAETLLHAVVTGIRPVATVKPVLAYNCAGLALRTYEYLGLAATKARLKQYKKLTDCSHKCTGCEIKLWFWEYKLGGDVYVSGTTDVVQRGKRHKDFHIVGGRVSCLDGRDLPNVYSKNGGGPLKGPDYAKNHRLPDRELVRKVTSGKVEYEVFKVRTDIQESCYCWDDAAKK